MRLIGSKRARIVSTIALTDVFAFFLDYFCTKVSSFPDFLRRLFEPSPFVAFSSNFWFRSSLIISIVFEPKVDNPIAEEGKLLRFPSTLHCWAPVPVISLSFKNCLARWDDCMLNRLLSSGISRQIPKWVRSRETLILKQGPWTIFLQYLHVAVDFCTPSKHVFPIY